MLRLYNMALLPLRVVTSAWASWDARRRPERAREWAERLGRMLPDPPCGGLWIHGASVGEARIVTALCTELRRLRPDLPLYASALTRTGRALLPSPPEAEHSFFAPLDFPRPVGRVLGALRPAALVLVETEIWPNLLGEARARSVPVALVNGRLSAERMSRYMKLRGLYRPLLQGLYRVGVQSAQDADRFVRLGAREDVVEVTGNIKFDLSVAAAEPALLRARFGIDGDRPVVVAGSTRPGEEEIVLDAWAEVRQRHPAAFLVLAPRHPNRAGEVEQTATRRGVALLRLSAGRDGDAGAFDGLLVDTVGDLGRLYAMAEVAFVGGSLVPGGGHNVLEPASLGIPVLFGPHTHHVNESAEALLDGGAALRVADGAALAQAIRSLLGDGAGRARMAAAAQEALHRNRGARERTLSMVLSMLERGSPIEALGSA